MLACADIKEFIQKPARENEILLTRGFLGSLKRGYEVYRLFSMVFRLTSILLSPMRFM
ncbi:MAG: hypothetical protein QXZ66_05205 [Thermoproteota archaeon]